MTRQFLIFVLILFLGLSAAVFAQDNDVETVVNSKVNKMQKALNLTDSQAAAIRPIVKDYLIKRQTVINETKGQGIVDHVAIKATLKELKDNEYKKLSRILTEDQMKKWVDKENMMAVLNPDSEESSVDDEVAITATGADFKF